MSESVRIALLGCGVVGGAVARRLSEAKDEFAARVGRPLEIIGVAVRDTGKDRSETGLDASLFTTDAETLVTEADLVIELMGGMEPAKSLLQKAIESGASVITANKALLGQHGAELYELAEEHGVDLYYEAAVAGAIPLIRPLRVSLAGDSVHRVMGIVNGTTNFILDKMDRTGAQLADVLAEAQELGYAEADPTADVEGHDAQAKAAILASLAFHTRVRTCDVHVEGIMGVTADDIRAARRIGCVIKLLAIAELVDKGGSQAVNVRVHPTLIDRSHPLASVREAFNAVFVETQMAGELMFYGPGAGGDPTASAVLGDVVQAARHKVTGGRGPGELSYANLPIEQIGASKTAYFIRLDVEDKPGVLANIAKTIGEQGVSIESMRQGVRRSQDGLATLHLITHRSSEADLADVVERLKASEDVREVGSVLRVEGE
ncbi:MULTISPECIES: homoserine dehydrogenase [unclassified Yimella]|uniref:homoserine dehydrogenase n=1 Tax=unclassified Yimella TaxID=2649892 RepID=UPI00101C57B5|nr:MULTISPECIES: homoserine dehydrogenase [unclassified Yimella]MCG8655904.1 homoserine dehydrogenase [Yimella sp. NH-Cas1]RYG77880.1 homoserine dehydrogenase [Yimella sp. RIT 621]